MSPPRRVGLGALLVLAVTVLLVWWAATDTAPPSDPTGATSGANDVADAMPDASIGHAPPSTQRHRMAGGDVTADAGSPDASEEPAPSGLVIRVRRPDGSPAAGAVVTTVTRPDGGFEGTRVTAGADGTVALDDLDLTGARWMHVALGEDLAAIVPRPAGDALDVALEPAVRVEGRVESTTGEALGGSECHLLPLETTTADLPQSLAVVTSSDDGGFRFSAVPISMVGTSPHVAAFLRLGSWDAGSAVAVDGVALIRLRSARTLEGRCLDTGALPLPGVAIFVGASRSVRSGPDGRFRIVGVPIEEHVVVFVDDAHAPHVTSVGSGRDDVGLGDVVLREGTTMRGVVRDGTGVPVPGATVRVAPAGPGEWERRARSGPSGRFEIAHVPDDSGIVAAAWVAGANWTSGPEDERGGRSPDRTLRLARTGDDEIELTIPPRRLVRLHLVRDGDGTPLRVTALYASDGREPRDCQSPEPSDVFVVHVAAGPADLTIQSRGWEPTVVHDVTPADWPIDRDVRLRPAAAAEGRR